MTIEPIAFIKTDFPEKFGTPRQAGLTQGKGIIEFIKDCKDESAVRGLEGFSYIWLIWGFSENKEGKWHPTVRPPRLGGNERLGVFATRSPFRPNALGLSSVRLLEIRKGPVLVVEGPDLVSGTPIYDIKPYLPCYDCHPDAKAGFASDGSHFTGLDVEMTEAVKDSLGEDYDILCQTLTQDPRPAYHHDPERIYHMRFKGWTVSFKASEGKAWVIGVQQASQDLPGK